ncbi:ABC transporter permease [Nonomuraea diastatica]|uniref:Autoinducer 2 import system permease protein LsrD n=1 Tax=Nonomuraea diastatica TaxID=1848329 RepID=A0A4R4VVD1_9ACTN|nr:ABC transporter permease [Nonomuraea diastatica]TDD10008.1 ABC transporter permease [Nonomuraea diastatica]
MTTGALPRRSMRDRVSDRRVFLAVLVVALGALMSLLSPYFLEVGNLLAMTQYGAVIGLLALGVSLVILGGRGGIDLSVGSALSLSGIFMGLLAQNLGLSPWLAALVTVAFGALLGSVNGFMVARLGLPPLIVTLSTLFLYGALAQVLTHGGQLGGFGREGFAALGQTAILGVPAQVLLVLAPAFAVAIWAQNRTALGRRLHQIGTSDRAAALAGIDVNKLRFRLYCVSGALAALGAVVTNAWLLTARPSAGLGMELQAITIAVLGGIHIFGGRGHLSGVLLALADVVVLSWGLQLAQVGNSVQTGVLGLVLVGAALLNNLIGRRAPG